MFIKKEEKELLALTSDPVARLLFLNAFFVIIGYGLAVASNLASVEIAKVIKSIFLFGSVSYLFITNRVKPTFKYFDFGSTPFLFCLLMFVFTLVTPDIFDSLNTLQTFVIPFLYIYFSLAYLISKYGIKTILQGIHWGILLIYSIPGLSYIFFGGDLSNTNIYGVEEGQAFVSNHYGWASALYILSFIFVIRNIKLKKFIKLFLWSVLIIATVLLFSSANRASWLSMSVAMIPLLLHYKGLKRWHKLTISCILVGFIIFFLSDPGSSINFQINRTLKQENEGEARFEVTAFMFNHFNDNPIDWFTGVGLFNYDLLKNKTELTGYHNSYWVILFGGGIPLFLVFLSFMVFRPAYRFIKYYSKYTLLFAPLLIIPFFESDLTGGQFLFFPWFTFMLLLNAKIKLWNKPHHERITHFSSSHAVLANN